MIGIGVATSAAGIVVGTVTLTGIGLVMTEFVEFISGGNLMLILIFTAVISLLLGMGLPTTANYIVVSSLMAPVIVDLGAQSGLIVPLIAVHLFVFYFGILADDTPPVGLAAFAAAGISGGDPIRTGIQGFTYDIRTAILPFMFIFNTELLIIGVVNWFHLIDCDRGRCCRHAGFCRGHPGVFPDQKPYLGNRCAVARGVYPVSTRFLVGHGFPPLIGRAGEQARTEWWKQWNPAPS